MAAAGVVSHHSPTARRPLGATRRRRRGGVVGCLLFVAAGGRRGRGDLCRCSPTGALKATPAALLGLGLWVDDTPHAPCMTMTMQPRDKRSSTPVIRRPANPTSHGCHLQRERERGQRAKLAYRNLTAIAAGRSTADGTRITFVAPNSSALLVSIITIWNLHRSELRGHI